MSSFPPELTAAIQAGDEQKVRQLLQKKEWRLNLVSSHGETLLHEACRCGQLGVVRMLVGMGGNVDVRDQFGCTPVLVAAKENHFDVVLTLVSEFYCDVNTKDSGGETLLHAACRHEQLELVIKLLSMGATVDRADQYGCTPLPVPELAGELLRDACRTGQLLTVRMMIKIGADINEEDVYGNTPMFKAIEGNHGDIIEALITEFDYNIHAQNSNGVTPLSNACDHERLKIILTLISLGADVNQKDSDGCIPVLKAEDSTGRTVLHEACQHGRLDIVRMLCELGADIYKKDMVGNTPIVAAIEGNHDDVVRALISEFGYDVKYITNNGRTVLHEACSQGRLEIVKELHQLGADVYKEDSYGNTSMSAAIVGDHGDVVEALITSFGYNIHAQNTFGITPLL